MIVVEDLSAIAMRSMRWPLWYSPDGPTSTTKRTKAKIAAATMPGCFFISATSSFSELFVRTRSRYGMRDDGRRGLRGRNDRGRDELGPAVLDARIRLSVLERDERPRGEDSPRGHDVRNDLEALHGAV